ncbi:MAG: phenylalanine 4-monooxygenase [Alphaproteobacteria bacterium]
MAFSVHRQPSDRTDHTITQQWSSYHAEEHALWRALFERQAKLLPDRACDEFLRGMHRLGVVADGIPDFRRLNEVLDKATGWQIVAVPGLVPDAIFFEHLANRRFPSTCFLRTPQQMDYIQEPDVFHDIFGHVPLLVHPVFADYMQAYGKGGLKALELGALKNLARLYWYTVEFGLIHTEAGQRIYGSGILSSPGETVFALGDPAPNRLGFDVMRIMRTEYCIDDFQETYFVIDSFEQLFEATAPDFSLYYKVLADERDIAPGHVIATDKIFTLGAGRRGDPISRQPFAGV